MKIKIKNDLFNISKRINKIDRKYYVVFDTDKKKFEIFCDDKKMLTLPYESLDKRAINYLIERVGKSNFEILEEVEKHNKRVEKNNLEKVVNSSMSVAEKILRRS